MYETREMCVLKNDIRSGDCRVRAMRVVRGKRGPNNRRPYKREIDRLIANLTRSSDGNDREKILNLT